MNALRRRREAADRGFVLTRARVRSEGGFGLIELLMSMTMLNIGILALVAAFQSGALALQRANKLSTAAAIADIQLERFRAVEYAAIAVDATALATADSTYTSYYSGSQVTTTCTTPLPIECDPSRALTGPDGKRYRIDSYVVYDTPSSGRVLKKVTLVVRDGQNLAGAPLATVQSTFDQATGS
jgi:Tfp pilus assembly protein PilE